MSKIRSRGTAPERKLRSLLSARGYHFSTYPSLPGTPDLVFREHKLAVFVDGEFWHGHNWLKKGIRPRHAFWRRKLLRNIARDLRVNKGLHALGWRYVRVLDSQVLRSPKYVLMRIRRALLA